MFSIFEVLTLDLGASRVCHNSLTFSGVASFASEYECSQLFSFPDMTIFFVIFSKNFPKNYNLFSKSEIPEL